MGASILTTPTPHTAVPFLLSTEELAEWRKVRTAAICDELKFTGGETPRHIGVIDPTIRCATKEQRFAGQALTLKTEPGEGAARAVLEVAWNGAVIVIDARAHPHTTVWGGNLIMAAKAAGVRGVVVDGLVRDRVELDRSTIPVFSRYVVPSGHSYGGQVNVPVAVGGVSVEPGDLVVGDEDGVVVVAQKYLPNLRERCLARMEEDRLTQARASGNHGGG